MLSESSFCSLGGQSQGFVAVRLAVAPARPGAGNLLLVKASAPSVEDDAALFEELFGAEGDEMDSVGLRTGPLPMALAVEPPQEPNRVWCHSCMSLVATSLPEAPVEDAGA